jgi:hypothetical protein
LLLTLYFAIFFELTVVSLSLSLQPRIIYNLFQNFIVALAPVDSQKQFLLVAGSGTNKQMEFKSQIAATYWH